MIVLFAFFLHMFIITRKKEGLKMPTIKIEDLLKISKQISSRYQMFLKEGMTKENLSKL